MAALSRHLSHYLRRHRLRGVHAAPTTKAYGSACSSSCISLNGLREQRFRKYAADTGPTNGRLHELQPLHVRYEHMCWGRHRADAATMDKRPTTKKLYIYIHIYTRVQHKLYLLYIYVLTLRPVPCAQGSFSSRHRVQNECSADLRVDSATSASSLVVSPAARRRCGLLPLRTLHLRGGT